MNETDADPSDVRPVLACLGVASRFRLVRALAEADRCVGELAIAVGLSQSCTTRHLQALERVGLVRGRREGRRVRFSLRAEAPGLGALLGWALSGPEADGLVAGGSLHRDRAGVPRVRMSARQAARRTVPATRPRSADGAHRAALAGPEAVAAGGPPGDGPVAGPGAGGPAPALRPGDLEDYLL